ncbi:WD40 repeat domain-containing serine/threonine protein kinase [Nocardiopsis sp. L17-MgMaSL7]|uniref:WD40 repeat domain-containing serine/threonine protein kinase n=1 Tax=Nocardiopsis sp. L17-MgMaSL7 TaxID=1938893 RepID=UPI000D71C8BE|nr:WD40 repeat domain-containing serine/threonine protein kinase [Nocardiopsis sp. L17-MgMaSL7]PWV45520.1 serine/threonine protein kinase [Nocardiopsis sp. L17-MgMaSL7]
MQPLASDDPNAIGPHRLLARLGAGGMGRVYLARTPDGHLCALKVVKEDLAHDTQFRARFAREVRTAQRVRGPFTPAVVDADPEAPAPWMATEYVPGPTLKEAVRENGPFPEDSLRVLALGLARALSTIHAAGLMHRDLKPSNILLSPRGPQVIDFGIARAVEGTVLTRTGQTFGTPSYTSPEQVTGQNVTPHADVFSMAGSVLFAASGRPPFGEGSPVNTLNRVMRGEPHLEAVPEGPLRDLLARCFAKDPAERPDADTVQREISALPLPSAEHGWLPSPVNQQITAKASETQRAKEAERPPSPPERGTKRRRTALVVGAAAASLVLLGGGALALNALPLGSDDTADTEPQADGEGDEGGSEPSELEDPAFEGFLYKIDFSEDGEQMHVFGSNTLSTWNWRDGAAVDHYSPAPTGAVFTPNGFAAGTTTDYVEVWEGGSDNRVAVIGNDEDEVRGHFDMPALTSDGGRVATLSSADGTEEGDPHIQVWDVQTREILSEFPSEGMLTDLFYTPDDSSLVGVVTDRSYTDYIGVIVWDPETGEELQRFDSANYYRVSLAADGRTLAMVTDRDRARIADLETGEVRDLEDPGLDHNELVEVQISPDGSLVYGATSEFSDEPGFVWDARSGDLVTTDNLVLNPPIGVHPDGEHIATASSPEAGVYTILILDADFDVVAEVS